MKLRQNAVIAAIFGVFAIVSVYAGTQYNWGTSTGQNWVTPDDTALTPNTFLVIQSTTGNIAPTVTTTGQPWLQSRTIAQINVTTATAVGQLVFCSNCTQSAVCISSGAVNFAQWVVVGSSAPLNTIVSCR